MAYLLKSYGRRRHELHGVLASLVLSPLVVWAGAGVFVLLNLLVVWLVYVYVSHELESHSRHRALVVSMALLWVLLYATAAWGNCRIGVRGNVQLPRVRERRWRRSCCQFRAIVRLLCIRFSESDSNARVVFEYANDHSSNLMQLNLLQSWNMIRNSVGKV